MGYLAFDRPAQLIQSVVRSLCRIAPLILIAFESRLSWPPLKALGDKWPQKACKSIRERRTSDVLRAPYKLSKSFSEKPDRLCRRTRARPNCCNQQAGRQSICGCLPAALTADDKLLLLGQFDFDPRRRRDGPLSAARAILLSSQPTRKPITMIFQYGESPRLKEFPAPDALSVDICLPFP